MSNVEPTLSTCAIAREEIDGHMYPRNPGAREGRGWFAARDIKNCLDINRIRAILDCYCDNCQYYLKQQGHADLCLRGRTPQAQKRIEQFASDIVGNVGSGGSLGSQMLFGLLIWVYCPPLIVSFLRNDRNDGDLRHWCHKEAQVDYDYRSISNELQGIMESSGPSPRGTFDSEAARFISQMYKFASPKFNWSGFRRFVDSTRMPFYEEKPLKRGVSAAVFAVKVHPDYLNRENRIGTGPHSNYFIRKELDPRTPLVDFLREEENLETVAQLWDDHIVRVHNTYKKGDRYNIVFPHALGDLDVFLIHPQPGFTNLITGPLRKKGLWFQMLGLARAMDRIINYDHGEMPNTPMRTSSRPLYQSQILGYHFDIKPENILVFADDSEHGPFVLKITDFGQAVFRETSNTSRMNNPGGTLTYAAPEGNLDGPHTLNTKYDVWSLGCVFTEMTIFLREGYGGLTAFRQQRTVTRRFGNCMVTDSCFFDVNENGDVASAILRPAVQRWIERCLQPREDEIPDSGFLTDIKELLIGMLQPQVRQRWTSRQVYSFFAEVMSRSNSGEIQHGCEFRSILFDQERTLVMGNNSVKLSDLRQIHARVRLPQGISFQPCRIQDIGTDDELELFTCTFSQTDTFNIKRPDGMVLVRYVAHSGQSNWDIRITKASGCACPRDFLSGSLLESRQIQSFLTGHEILGSYIVHDVTMHTATGISDQLKQVSVPVRRFWRSSDEARDLREVPAGMLSPMRNSSGAPSELEARQPCTMQLWKEAIERKPRRPHGPPPVTTFRLVIFKDGCLWILPFSVANRSDCPEYFNVKGRPANAPSSVVLLYPRKSYPCLECFCLTPDNDSDVQVAGIPMDLEVLYEKEQKALRSVKKVQVTFHDPNDAQQFRRDYRTIDQRWNQINTPATH